MEQASRPVETKKKSNVRVVKDYLVFQNEHLGKGQYGHVCKARLQSEAKKKDAKVFACKIMEIANVPQEELDCIQKEVHIHNMIDSKHCVKLYQSIKTQSNIYMMQDYCNGFDLQILLKLRKRLTQIEVSMILRQVVKGCIDVWNLSVIHRDIKLANVLLHFPDNPEVDSMSRSDKFAFVKQFNFSTGSFKAVLSDFGLSTIVYEGSNSQLSICGTPLYSSPQLLKKKGYSYKVDIWALGIMCYEMLMGTTPFHSFEMKELINKINKGDYLLALGEPILMETALFLVNCLHSNESDRIGADRLPDHPFVNMLALSENECYTAAPNVLDKETYLKELSRVNKLTQNTAEIE